MIQPDDMPTPNELKILDQAGEIEILRAALADAIECVIEWGEYAPNYFKEKHKLQDDIDRLKKAIRPL
jgi:hypothetical protein